MARNKRYEITQMFPGSARPRGRSRGVPGWAIIGIFLILLFHFITTASEFLMPVTLAFLLFFVFARVRRLMGRFGIGPGISAAIITVGMIVMLGVLGYFVSGPVAQIAANSDQIAVRLEERLGSLRETVKPLEEAAAKIDELSGAAATDDAETADDPTVTPGSVRVETGAGGAETADPGEEIEVTVEASTSPTTMQTIATAGPTVISQIVFTLILLFFLLASGDLMYLKIVQSFETMREKRAAYMAIREIETSLGSYLGAITLINAGLSVYIGLAMWLWGMPQPLLWAVAAFILNFIPYLGAIAGVVAAFVVALITFDDLGTPLLVAGTYLLGTSIEGQLVTPYFVSRRLSLNTVVVFITVALWAWLWSVLGMVVAVPILVVLKVLADHIPGLQKFGNFLAGEDPPELEDEDEEEARDLVRVGDEADTVEEARAETAEVVSASTGAARPS